MYAVRWRNPAAHKRGGSRLSPSVRNCAVLYPRKARLLQAGIAGIRRCFMQMLRTATSFHGPRGCAGATVLAAVVATMKKSYPCPCCGYLTLSEEPPGTFEVCPVCYWEDDLAQFKDPTYAGGANNVSLQEARRNFHQFGAMSAEFVDNVRK